MRWLTFFYRSIGVSKQQRWHQSSRLCDEHVSCSKKQKQVIWLLRIFYSSSCVCFIECLLLFAAFDRENKSDRDTARPNSIHAFGINMWDYWFDGKLLLDLRLLPFKIVSILTDWLAFLSPSRSVCLCVSVRFSQLKIDSMHWISRKIIAETVSIPHCINRSHECGFVLYRTFLEIPSIGTLCRTRSDISLDEN